MPQHVSVAHSFCARLVLGCNGKPRGVSLFVAPKHLLCFCWGAAGENAAGNEHIRVFDSPKCISRNERAGSEGAPMFHFLRNGQTVFHSDAVILCSQQWSRKVPLSLASSPGLGTACLSS